MRMMRIPHHHPDESSASPDDEDADDEDARVLRKSRSKEVK